MRSPFVLLLLAIILHAGVVWGMQEEKQPAWGVNAVVLKSPWNGSPSMNDLLADREHTLVLDRFYRVGGVERAATPTECRISYNTNALFVVLSCREKDMAFPASDLFFPDTNRQANWDSLFGLPSGPDDCWPPFPDEVDLLIQPDTASPFCYQFAATPDGSKFGCTRPFSSNPDVVPDDHPPRPTAVTRLDAFELSVARTANEWRVFFRIPWATLGGRPGSTFGLLPMRTRFRDGEFSSPVAIDFEECLPADLLIETHFSGDGRVQGPRTSLCQLPSGLLRWQRPATMFHPDAKTLQQIWEMESSLATPTDTNNLGQRLYLTQCWMDLMTREGFQPRPHAWRLMTNNLTLAFIRQKVNAAFQQNNPGLACQRLDEYLGRLDKMSRWWYADGSPGDILKQEWTPLATVESLETQGNTLRMRCLAGGHKVDLHLALPKTGGVRIYGSDEGFFKPADLLPLETSQTAKSCSLKTADGKVVISRKPFSVVFYNNAGRAVTQIGANALAFRFGPDGKILAIDFKNHLDSKEVIYGFGEKYDRFNQNGNVLTLWGTDDWVGNGLALRNTSYKIVPVFHSSKGYMVFDNSSYRLRGDIGQMDPSQYRLTQQGPVFDFYFWIGTPGKALQSYTALTGRCPLPPKWVFEPWLGRGGRAWATGPLHNAVAEEENAYTQCAALDIPHSAIYAEGQSANSPELNEFMAAHHIKVLGYFMPAVGQSRIESLMPELKPEELPLLRCGSPSETRLVGYVDFTNPNALELMRRYLKQALDVGVAGSMVDFGDVVPDEAVFYDGKRGDEMHNFYSYAYHKTISEVYRERRGDDFILFGRAATPGDQHWVGQFAGDHPSNFDGLKAVVTGALNLCACGFSTWGSDLGGYFGLPEPAVYMRWIEFGCFSPIWRPHGKSTREPWYFGDAAVASYKYDAWVRENILNYTYNAAVIAHETGVPIMRSMPVSFPDEPAVAAVRDQYMFGGDLLVAPVITDDTFRTVLFPSGVWTSLWDGKTVSGPARLKISAPLDVIPVYLRPGAVVPVQLNRGLQFGQSLSSGRVSALVVTPPKGNETVSPVNEKGEATKVTVQSRANGSAWKLENLPEMSYVLVYGITGVATVKVDGEVLPKLTAAGFDMMPAGWEADLAGNRLVIRLPSDQAGQNRLTREIAVDFSPGRQ
jgi:alpha-glucosidase (family GH31 glycosyl hydrolase)